MGGSGIVTNRKFIQDMWFIWKLQEYDKHPDPNIPCAQLLPKIGKIPSSRILEKRAASHAPFSP